MVATPTLPERHTASHLPYAAGRILTDTRAHLDKLNEARRHIRARQSQRLPLYNVSGLERRITLPDQLDPWVLDDEWGGAVYVEQIRDLGLEHLGGDPNAHDIFVANRQTAALFAALQVTARPGSTVIGVSPSYSHPCVVRAAVDAGAEFIDTAGLEHYKAAVSRSSDLSVVVITRLASTYTILSVEDIEHIVELARGRGALVVMDDAGGARVGPAVLGQPRMLEFGVDLGSTGLDKYGVIGPRVGLLGGRCDLVARARARAFELGTECRPALYPAVVHGLRSYRPERVRKLLDSGQQVGDALRTALGNWVEQTPFITVLPGEAIRAEIHKRNPAAYVELAPIEANAALAMVMLRDHGLLTIHFAGLPPGTPDLLIKFLPPETVTAIGGANAFAAVVDEALDRAAHTVSDQPATTQLLLGTRGVTSDKM